MNHRQGCLCPVCKDERRRQSQETGNAVIYMQAAWFQKYFQRQANRNFK